MTRYALIDENSGFVWGVAEAESPISACRLIDESPGERNRTYSDIGGQRFDGRSGYHVFEAPDHFDCDDGQDQEQIDTVASFPIAARVIVEMIED